MHFQRQRIAPLRRAERDAQNEWRRSVEDQTVEFGIAVGHVTLLMGLSTRITKRFDERGFDFLAPSHCGALKYLRDRWRSFPASNAANRGVEPIKIAALDLVGQPSPI